MGDKNQLHALLAVEADKRKLAEQILLETVTTFSKRQEHFDGIRKIYSAYNENSTDKIPPEIKNIVTTVDEKLNYTKTSVIEAIDAQISKEESNTSQDANAELTVDGTSFGRFCPTSLLALESRLVAIRNVYKEIPTIDPTRDWEKTDYEGKKVYATKPEVKYRTNKIQKPLVLAPATDKHPAQVQLVVEDQQVGQYETTYYTGRISPTEKSQLLARIDRIIEAVKLARAKANQVEAKQIKVGEKLFSFIHQGITK